MAQQHWGVFHEQHGKNVRTGGYMRDEKGLPRVFTEEQAKEHAERCRKQAGYCRGETWQAKPLQDFVLQYIHENGGQV